MKQLVRSMIILGIAVPVLAAPAETAQQAAQAAIRKAHDTVKAQMDAYAAHKAAGKPRAAFKWDFAAPLAAVEARLPKEKRPEVKQALLVARFAYKLFGKQDIEPAFAAQLLREVPAVSPAWGIEPSLFAELADLAQDKKAVEAYVAEAREKSPVPEVRAQLLLDQFEDALDLRQEAVWKAALATLERDHAGTPALKRAQDGLAAAQKTAIGAPAPAFSIAALGDPATTYTLDTFKGKYVLIDFWATWCPPCRGEMPSLHKAYARFHGPAFEILSLSFDQKAADIAPFRQQAATPMPWKHAFVEKGFMSELAQAYGVKGIPKPLLVGPDGRILAAGAELRGEQLEKTLEKYLK